MKVLHFVPYYPPDRVGGVGDFVAGLHGALLREGHESTVVTAGRSSERRVHRIAVRPLPWFFKTALWARRAQQYDIVHCQAGESLPVQLFLRLFRRQPKVLVTFHVTFTGISKAFRPYRIEDRTFARGVRPLIYRTAVSWLHMALDRSSVALADEVNTTSRQAAIEVLGEQAAPSATVIYYGLPDLVPDPKEVDTISPAELLFVASGGHRKRVAALPFVLRDVRRECPQARLRILGLRPEQEPRAVALFQEFGLLEAVDFAGVTTAEALPPYYRQAAVLLVPSAYEGLPLVMIEAMRERLPIVATRVSGHPEAIEHGRSGYLVDVDDTATMARHCVELLKDSDRAASFGRRAREIYEERFTLERQLREYLELYRRMLE